MVAMHLALSLSARVCIMALSIAHYPPENKYPRADDPPGAPFGYRVCQ
jgi:hypothetical protein